MRAVELQHTWRGLLSECNRSRFNLVNASMRGMQQHNYRSLYNIHLYTPVLSTHIHSPFCLVPSLALFLFLFRAEKRTDWGFALLTLLFPPLRLRSLLIPHSWLAILKTWEKSLEMAPGQEKNNIWKSYRWTQPLKWFKKIFILEFLIQCVVLFICKL